MSAEKVIILISNLNYSYKTLGRKQEERKKFRDQDMCIHIGDKTDNAKWRRYPSWSIDRKEKC